jgi:hypothetical protein
MKKNDEKRLHEVMGRLDKTFKSKFNEGFEEMIPTDDVEVPVDGAEEMPVEEKSVEEKYEELKIKVEELYGMINGEEGEEMPTDDPLAGIEEPEVDDVVGVETGEVEPIQEWNFDKKKGKEDAEGEDKTPAEEKEEEIDEDVTTTVTEKKGKALSADKAPEVEVGK